MLLIRTLHRIGPLLIAALLFNAALSGTTIARAQTTSFTYQGKLTDGGAPTNALYDFVFTLWDAQTNGNQIGSPVTVQNTPIVDGIFTVTLDFGAGAFNGAARFLEISVKPTGNPAPPTLLSPRQQVVSTPYAIKSLVSSSADGLSAACVNCITSNQIASVNGSSITGPIPVASLPAGSGNYIQNATAQQASSNFNISGTGKADIVDATTQYNLGGARILSAAGSSNLFAGAGAGAANASGSSNSFFGNGAGQSNTTGGGNAFFGSTAGLLNTGGPSNAFFGAQAGQSNTTGGSNVFVGYQAGFSNGSG